MTKPFPFFRLPQELRDRMYDSVGGQDVEFQLELPSQIAREDVQQDGSVLCKFQKYADEIYRHTTLRLNASDNDTGFRHRLTDSYGNMKKWIGREAHLEIAYSIGHRVPGKPQDIASTDARGLGIAMMGCMESIRSIELHRHIDIAPFCGATNLPFEQAKAGFVHYFRKVRSLIQRRDGHPVSLLTRLFFHCPLAMVLKSYQPTEADKQNYPLTFQSFGGWEGVAAVLDGLISNLAMYEAVQTEDEESWYGLKLELVARADTYDIAANLRQLEKFEERVARWNDRLAEGDNEV